MFWITFHVFKRLDKFHNLVDIIYTTKYILEIDNLFLKMFLKSLEALGDLTYTTSHKKCLYKCQDVNETSMRSKLNFYLLLSSAWSYSASSNNN